MLIEAFVKLIVDVPNDANPFEVFPCHDMESAARCLLHPVETWGGVVREQHISLDVVEPKVGPNGETEYVPVRGVINVETKLG